VAGREARYREGIQRGAKSDIGTAEASAVIPAGASDLFISLGVSDGIRTRDIQDYNVAKELMKQLLSEVPAAQGQ
jgi:hypothetical protein